MHLCARFYLPPRTCFSPTPAQPLSHVGTAAGVWGNVYHAPPDTFLSTAHSAALSLSSFDFFFGGKPGKIMQTIEDQDYSIVFRFCCLCCLLIYIVQASGGLFYQAWTALVVIDLPVTLPKLRPWLDFHVFLYLKLLLIFFTKNKLRRIKWLTRTFQVHNPKQRKRKRTERKLKHISLSKAKK